MRAFYLVAAVVLSLAMALDLVASVQLGPSIEEHLLTLHQFVVSLLLVAWLVTDPKLPAAYRPTLDHGFLLLVLFPLLALYHLTVSRGWKGVAIAVGFTLICLAPFLALLLTLAAG